MTINRYDRQIRVAHIRQSGQEAIQQSNVAIIGCGALGTYAAEQLVRAGIQSLILIDPDTVELTNLQRQTLFTERDVSNQELKVNAAKRALQKIRADVTIYPYAESFHSSLLTNNLCAIDLVLDCTDNFVVRDQINHWALQQNCPFIFASCAGTAGQVMAITPNDGPCLQCAFPQMKQLADKSCDLLGVSTPLIPFISSIQISLAIQYLTGATLDWNKMYLVDNWALSISPFIIKKNKHCPICSQSESISGIENSVVHPLKKLCGEQAYQAKLSTLSLTKAEKFCQKYNLPYQKNALAIRWAEDHFKITVFKNQTVHLFGFDCKEEALPYYTTLANYMEDLTR